MIEPDVQEPNPTEDENPTQAVYSGRELRLKSLILLFVLMLPTFLIILEILTGRVSGWWTEKAAPLLPHIELVHF